MSLEVINQRVFPHADFRLTTANSYFIKSPWTEYAEENLGVSSEMKKRGITKETYGQWFFWQLNLYKRVLEPRVSNLADILKDPSEKFNGLKELMGLMPLWELSFREKRFYLIGPDRLFCGSGVVLKETPEKVEKELFFEDGNSFYYFEREYKEGVLSRVVRIFTLDAGKSDKAVCVVRNPNVPAYAHSEVNNRFNVFFTNQKLPGQFFFDMARDNRPWNDFSIDKKIGSYIERLEI